MNIFEKAKLLWTLKRGSQQVEDAIQMKNATKIIAAIFALLTSVLQFPDVQHGVLQLVAAHPSVSVLITGLIGILALVHDPNAQTKQTSNLAASKIVPLAIAAMILIPACSAHSQTVPTNIYAVGISFNNGASSPVAGSGLYAHDLPSLSSGSSAFAIADILPNTVKPFTVTSNISAGVAQKILTIGKYPIYIPSSVGISKSAYNLGWDWNTGALTAVPIKGKLTFFPSVRMLKSSVSDGSGYQVIIGGMFGLTQ